MIKQDLFDKLVLETNCTPRYVQALKAIFVDGLAIASAVRVYGVDRSNLYRNVLRIRTKLTIGGKCDKCGNTTHAP